MAELLDSTFTGEVEFNGSIKTDKLNLSDINCNLTLGLPGTCLGIDVNYPDLILTKSKNNKFYWYHRLELVSKEENQTTIDDNLPYIYPHIPSSGYFMPAKNSYFREEIYSTSTNTYSTEQIAFHIYGYSSIDGSMILDKYIETATKYCRIEIMRISVSALSDICHITITDGNKMYFSTVNSAEVKKFGISLNIGTTATIGETIYSTKPLILNFD